MQGNIINWYPLMTVIRSHLILHGVAAHERTRTSRRENLIRSGFMWSVQHASVCFVVRPSWHLIPLVTVAFHFYLKNWNSISGLAINPVSLALDWNEACCYYWVRVASSNHARFFFLVWCKITNTHIIREIELFLF